MTYTREGVAIPPNGPFVEGIMQVTGRDFNVRLENAGRVVRIAAMNGGSLLYLSDHVQAAIDLGNDFTNLRPYFGYEEAGPDSSFTIPSRIGLDEIAADRFANLDVAKLKLVYAEGAEFSDEEHLAGIPEAAGGEYKLATDPESALHDIIIHGLPVEALPRKSVELHQLLTHDAFDLKVSNPEAAGVYVHALAGSLEIIGSMAALSVDAEELCKGLPGLITRFVYECEQLEADPATAALMPAIYERAGPLLETTLVTSEGRRKKSQTILEWERDNIRAHYAQIRTALGETPERKQAGREALGHQSTKFWDLVGKSLGLR